MFGSLTQLVPHQQLYRLEFTKILVIVFDSWNELGIYITWDESISSVEIHVERFTTWDNEVTHRFGKLREITDCLENNVTDCISHIRVYHLFKTFIFVHAMYSFPESRKVTIFVIFFKNWVIEEQILFHEPLDDRLWIYFRVHYYILI